MATIGKSIIITGAVTSDEDLLVEGRIHGEVSVPNATLTVGPQGYVEKDVRGARIQIHGAVKGMVIATERIELGPSAAVIGSLSANQVVMADGAQFKGRIDMDRRTISVRVAQFKADQARAR